MTAAAILGALFALLIAQASSANAGVLDPILPTATPTPNTGVLDPLLNQLLPTSSALPLPSLPGTDDLLPTPVSSVLQPVTGKLNDTIKTVDGLLNPKDQSGEPGGTGGTGGSGGSSTTTTGGSRGAKGTSGSSRSNGTTRLDGIGPFTTVTGATFRSAYGTTAGHAAVKAASRALRLMAPLAPALLLAGIAFGILMMLTRGSHRLVKLDPSGIAKRTWRL